MKEVQEEQHSAHISPSNIIARVGGRFRGFLSRDNHTKSSLPDVISYNLSPNPPPLNPQREGPTEQDKLLANSEIPTLETVLADFLADFSKQQSKRELRLVLKTAAATGVATGGTIFALMKTVFADEPISEPIPASRDISSIVGPTSFNDTGLDDRLVPRADTNKDRAFDNTAEKGRIGRDNIHYVNRADIKALPTEDELGNPLFLFPLALDPEDNIKYDRDYPGRVRLHNVKAGTPIIAGRDGYAFTWYSLIRGKDGKRIPAPAGKTYGITLTSIGSDGNAHMFVVDTTGNTANPDSLLNSLENIPSMDPSNSNGRDFTKGLPVKTGDVLGYINEDIDLLQLQLGVRRMEGKELNPMEAIPKRLNFVAQNELAPKLYVVKPETPKTLSK